MCELGILLQPPGGYTASMLILNFMSFKMFPGIKYFCLNLFKVKAKKSKWQVILIQDLNSNINSEEVRESTGVVFINISTTKWTSLLSFTWPELECKHSKCWPIKNTHLKTNNKHCTSWFDFFLKLFIVWSKMQACSGNYNNKQRNAEVCEYFLHKHISSYPALWFSKTQLEISFCKLFLCECTWESVTKKPQH